MGPYRPIEAIPDEVKRRKQRVLLKFDTGPEEIGRWNAYMRSWQLDNGLFCSPVSWHPLPSDTDTSEVERDLANLVSRIRELKRSEDACVGNDWSVREDPRLAGFSILTQWEYGLNETCSVWVARGMSPICAELICLLNNEGVRILETLAALSSVKEDGNA